MQQQYDSNANDLNEKYFLEKYLQVFNIDNGKSQSINFFLFSIKIFGLTFRAFACTLAFKR